MMLTLCGALVASAASSETGGAVRAAHRAGASGASKRSSGKAGGGRGAASGKGNDWYFDGADWVRRQVNASGSGAVPRGAAKLHEAAAKAKRGRRAGGALNTSHADGASDRPARLPACSAHHDPATRKKAAGRQRLCLKPEMVAAAASTTFPLLWSQNLVAERPMFLNENPFSTQKFQPFLSQLPSTTNISHLWHGGCDECDTCAVVGASGSSLRYRHGALIDAHQVVLRPNWIVTKGFEAIVGTKTHLNFFFGMEAMIEQFDAEMMKRPHEQRALGLVTPASDRSVASFFRHLGRGKRNTTKFGRESGSAVHLLTDDVYHKAFSVLCGATEGGCMWRKNTARMRPSTGFLAVVFAMRLCRKVSLFGLTSDPCMPFHYYGRPPKECTAETQIPPRHDESFHWFEKEHETYGQWAASGKLTIYS